MKKYISIPIPKFICRFIWNVSEFTGIPLGKYAPFIFGGMIGRQPKKKI
jgi:hypothetical protein